MTATRRVSGRINVGKLVDADDTIAIDAQGDRQLTTVFDGSLASVAMLGCSIAETMRWGVGWAPPTDTLTRLLLMVGNAHPTKLEQAANREVVCFGAAARE